jgi:hypothetical protein
MDTERFAALIDAKLAVLVQLHELARRQLDVIADGELTTLLTLLAGKQRLVLALQQLDAQLAPYAKQLPQERQWSSPAARERCQHQATRCEAVLRELLTFEQTAEQKLQAERTATADRMAALERSSFAHQAYLNSPQPVGGGLHLSAEG